MAITTIIFDLDDTLLWDKKSIQLAFDKTCAYAAQKVKVDAQELEKVARQTARELYEGYETYDYTVLIGINPFEGLWGNFDDPTPQFQKMKEIVPNYRKDTWTQSLAKLGVNDEAFGAELGEYFVQARIDSPCLYDDTFAVLDTLKEQYKLILLTNGAPSLQNQKLEITPELVPYFEHIIISGDFGEGKPSAAIFEHVMQVAAISADEAIMVGDNLNTDILGSSRVNMKNVWINRDNNQAQNVQPTYEMKSLTELVALVKTLG